MKKAHLMLVVHNLLILVSSTRILLHKMTLTELVTALPRDWPQLQSLTLTFLQSASNTVQLGYSQMRQTRLVTALCVAPPAWVAWSIAVIGWWANLKTTHALYLPTDLPFACWLLGSPLDSWRFHTIIALVCLYDHWHSKFHKGSHWCCQLDSQRGKILSWIFLHILVPCARNCRKRSEASNHETLWHCLLLLWHGAERTCQVLGVIWISEYFSASWDHWVFSPLLRLVQMCLSSLSKMLFWCMLNIAKPGLGFLLLPVWWGLRVVTLCVSCLGPPLCAIISLVGAVLYCFLQPLRLVLALAKLCLSWVIWCVWWIKAPFKLVVSLTGTCMHGVIWLINRLTDVAVVYLGAQSAWAVWTIKFGLWFFVYCIVGVLFEYACLEHKQDLAKKSDGAAGPLAAGQQ